MTEPRTVSLPSETSLDELALIRAANDGNEEARLPVRAWLASHPSVAEEVGTLAAEAEAVLLSVGARGNILIEEARRVELHEIRHRLSRPTDETLEALLVERVALSWFALMLAERTRASKWNERLSADTVEFWDRHVGRLHAEFLSASTVLARVRRLRLPALQVNVAGRQVNVAG